MSHYNLAKLTKILIKQPQSKTLLNIVEEGLLKYSRPMIAEGFANTALFAI